MLTELSEDEIDNAKCDGIGFDRRSTCCKDQEKETEETECPGNGCFDYNEGIVLICPRERRQAFSTYLDGEHFFFIKYFCLILGLLKSRISK